MLINRRGLDIEVKRLNSIRSVDYFRSLYCIVLTPFHYNFVPTEKVYNRQNKASQTPESVYVLNQYQQPSLPVCPSARMKISQTMVK